MVYGVEQRVARAKATTTNSRNLCLRHVRTWCGVSARYPSARLAGLAVAKADRILDRRKVPVGFPVFLKRRTADVFGHIALVVGHAPDGEPLVRSTDYPQAKVTSTVRLDALERAWGFRFTWGARTLNGTRLPGAPAAHQAPVRPQEPSGVVLAHLSHGQRHEDVRALQAALNRHLGSGIPVTGFYGDLTDAAVRKCQGLHDLGHDLPGHSSVGPRQAAHLGLKVRT
jgi:Putative peptidoglycan binding domain